MAGFSLTSAVIYAKAALLQENKSYYTLNGRSGRFQSPSGSFALPRIGRVFKKSFEKI
jgi:hypothetical protein